MSSTTCKKGGVGSLRNGIYVQQALDPQSEFGRFAYFDSKEYDRSVVHNLMSSWPNEEMEREVRQKILSKDGRWITRDDLTNLIQHAFREVKPRNKKELGRFLDFGIDTLKELHNLFGLMSTTSVYHNKENNITVTTTTSASPTNMKGESSTKTFFFTALPLRIMVIALYSY